MDEKSKFEMKIDVWKKTIDVQMHFNDLCLKLRHVGISILGVLLGGAALTYRFGGTFDFFSYKIRIAVIFILIALIIWIAFYLMDRFWYHELLKGAVHHGLKIEESFNKNDGSFVMIGLAGTIRDQSHSSLKMNAAKNLIYFMGLLVLY